jgi:hypothetical protein
VLPRAALSAVSAGLGPAAGGGRRLPQVAPSRNTSKRVSHRHCRAQGFAAMTTTTTAQRYGGRSATARRTCPLVEQEAAPATRGRPGRRARERRPRHEPRRSRALPVRVGMRLNQLGYHELVEAQTAARASSAVSYSAAELREHLTHARAVSQPTPVVRKLPLCRRLTGPSRRLHCSVESGISSGAGRASAGALGGAVLARPPGPTP